MMIYGIIGLFVMVSVWGLVNLLSNTFKLDKQFPRDLPSFGKTGSVPSASDRSRYNYGILPSERDKLDNTGLEEYKGGDSESLKDIYDRANQ